MSGRHNQKIPAFVILDRVRQFRRVKVGDTAREVPKARYCVLRTILMIPAALGLKGPRVARMTTGYQMNERER